MALLVAVRQFNSEQDQPVCNFHVTSEGSYPAPRPWKPASDTHRAQRLDFVPEHICHIDTLSHRRQHSRTSHRWSQDWS